ncbi:serine hydrolase [Streptomyces sp. NPDC006012]|uniref:serine hydrolase n=1 Tax=Streptomyces sp. NPDC006012 TaxID=3364739 RepID=UPI0036C5D3FF
MTRALAALTLPAEVSVWCARPGAAAAFAHGADTPHYAASLIKLAVLRAAHRDLDLDADVLVHDEFASVHSGRYRTDRDYDNDDEPWQELGRTVSLRRLCHRMIAASSNLATDLVLEAVGLPAVVSCAPAGAHIARPIGDRAAIAAGLTNTVTAAAAGALLAELIRTGDPSLLAPLRDQRYRDEIPAALPPGTAVANKNGWVDGVLHDVALIEPPDAPAYLLAVCTSGLPGDGARALVHTVAAASFADRHRLAAGPSTAHKEPHAHH